MAIAILVCAAVFAYWFIQKCILRIQVSQVIFEAEMLKNNAGGSY